MKNQMNSRKRERRPVEDSHRGDFCDRKWMWVCVCLPRVTHSGSAGSGWFTALLLLGLRLLIGSWGGSFLLGLTWSEHGSNYTSEPHTHTNKHPTAYFIPLVPYFDIICVLFYIPAIFTVNPGCKMLITSNKHEGKTDPTALQPLSLPCVCQGEIHAYLRYPPGPLSDTSPYASFHHPLSFPPLYLPRGWG